MKHTEWLRLKTEGENICAILRQQGYCCTKQTRRLSWKITTEGVSYVLTWLPAPVGDWSLIPKDDSPAREQLVSIVQNALTKGEKASTSQPISSIEDLHRPRAIRTDFARRSTLHSGAFLQPPRCGGSQKTFAAVYPSGSVRDCV
jgi:hypothetical protein